jgi:hypothetical protein
VFSFHFSSPYFSCYIFWFFLRKGYVVHIVFRRVSVWDKLDGIWQVGGMAENWFMRILI